MDWVVALGATRLGVVIGALVGFYIDEAEQLGIKVIRSAIAVLAGGGVVALFKLLAMPGIERELWCYPVGLLIGFLVALIFNWLAPPERA